MVIYSTGGQADFSLTASLHTDVNLTDGGNTYLPPGLDDPYLSRDIPVDRTDRFAHHFLNDPRPKFILDLEGRILACNTKGRDLLTQRTFVESADGCLAYGSAEQTAHVRGLITELRSGRAKRKRHLKRLQDDSWLALEFSRIHLNEVDDEILLIIKHKGVCRAPALDALAQAFNLTLTESKVVRHMSEAYCPKEIATEMGISVNTVRAHLRSIYSKTGVRGYTRTLKLILQLIA